MQFDQRNIGKKQSLSENLFDVNVDVIFVSGLIAFISYSRLIQILLTSCFNDTWRIILYLPHKRSNGRLKRPECVFLVFWPSYFLSYLKHVYLWKHSGFSIGKQISAVKRFLVFSPSLRALPKTSWELRTAISLKDKVHVRSICKRVIKELLHGRELH